MKYSNHNTIEPENEYEEVYLQLLRFCCASEENVKDEDFINASIRSLNALPHYAKLHFRLVPIMLEKVLKHRLEPLLDDATMDFLKAETQKGVAAELGKKQQLLEIIDIFGKAEIPLILLKASAFNGSIYTEKFPRLSNDIDILVKECDWETSKKVLSNIMDKQLVDLNGAFDDLYESSFIPKKHVGFNVDLHKSLVHPVIFKIDENVLWATSKIHPKYNDKNIRILAPEIALLHQAIHAFKDLNFVKYNVVDTYRILTLQSPCLKDTITTSVLFKTKTPLYFLLKTQNIVPLECRDTTNQKIRKIRPSRVRVSLINKLLSYSLEQRKKSIKGLNFRVRQIAAQYLFSNDPLRAVRFQLLFVYLTIVRVILHNNKRLKCLYNLNRYNVKN